MKCYFPIPSTPINHQRVIPNAGVNNCHSATTIQKLREENELLKQQIQLLMRTRYPIQPPKANFPKFVSPQRTTIFNQEDLVQHNYQSKMSKLKSVRSCSKKPISQYVTAPNSPQKVLQKNDSIPRTPFISIPLNRQNLKVMIVQRDGDGKFYRDRQSEQKVKTIRMNSPQNRKSQMQSNFGKANTTQNHTSRPFTKDTHRIKTHQRSETAPIQSQYPNRGDSTKRVTSRQINTNDFVNFCQLSRQVLEKNHQASLFPPKTNSFKNTNSFKKVNNQQVKLNLNRNFQENRQVQKIKLSSPRGVAYIDQSQAQTRQPTKKSTDQDHQSNAQSVLSIQKELNDTKRKRKLCYEIYLEDQKTN